MSNTETTTMVNLKEKIQSIIQLPTLPGIAVEVINMVDNPKTSASALGQIISKDQVLAAKVLKIANSPFYGFSKKIATIDFAIIVLGFDTLKEVVLSVSLISTLAKKRTKNFDMNQFWNHSVACGIVARTLARNYGYRVIGEVFIAGLLHDIGILILNQYFFSAFKEISRLYHEEGIGLEESEKHVLGVTHAEVGAWLAERWNFPPQLIDSIAFHHYPKRSDKHSDIVSIIHIADVLCQKLENGFFDLEQNIDFDRNLSDTTDFYNINTSDIFLENYKQVFEEEIIRARTIIP